MAFYNFKCDNCNTEVEKMWSSTKYDELTYVKSGTENGDSYMNEVCEKCNGDMKRVIGQIGMGLDIYKNDPNSNQYWKKGKSNMQVSQIIESHSSSSPY